MRLETINAMAAGLATGGGIMSNTMGATMGYEDEMDNVIGAAVQRFMANRGAGGGQMARRPMGGQQMQRQGYPQNVGMVGQTYAYPPLQASPMHQPAKLRSFVGLGVITWTGAADAADKKTSITPQAPVRGERLVIDVVATSGAAGLVTVKLVEVGVEPQQADTSQPAPASMFAKDVTYGHIAMQIANPGIQIAVTLGITASPGAGETVTAAVGLFVEWVR